MSSFVSIVGLDRADVLATLYNASKPQAWGCCSTIRGT